MSAPSPKKTATAKKPRTVAERRADNVTRFDEYRARAAKIKGDTTADVPPYIVPAAELDDGIDADLILTRPGNLAGRTALDRAVRSNDLVSIVVVMGGQTALNRIVAAFDRLAEDTGEDATRLFAAFGYSVVNHLNGAGAADVPGGTSGS